MIRASDVRTASWRMITPLRSPLQPSDYCSVISPDAAADVLSFDRRVDLARGAGSLPSHRDTAFDAASRVVDPAHYHTAVLRAVVANADDKRVRVGVVPPSPEDQCAGVGR